MITRNLLHQIELLARKASNEIVQFGKIDSQRERILNGLYRSQASIGESKVREAKNSELVSLLISRVDRTEEHADNDLELNNLLAQVMAHASLDLDAPLASEIPGGQAGKRLLAKLIRWYLGYIGTQVDSFMTASARAIHYLANQSLHSNPSYFRSDRMDFDCKYPSLDATWWIAYPKQVLLSNDGIPSGNPILHLGCNQLELLEALRENHLKCYGVKRPYGPLDQGTLDRLDIREEDPFEHLDSVGEDSLAGIIASNIVEILSPREVVDFVRRVDRALGDDGFCFVYSISRKGWDEQIDSPYRDLSIYKPISSSTWLYLFSQLGFECKAIEPHDKVDFLIVARRPNL
jgi:hypothetical protein